MKVYFIWDLRSGAYISVWSNWNYKVEHALRYGVTELEAIAAKDGVFSLSGLGGLETFLVTWAQDGWDACEGLIG